MVPEKTVLMCGEVVMTEEEKASRLQQAEENLKAGRYREAITSYRALAGSSPEDESLLLSLAWAYYDSGNREQAIDCFERLFDRELARSVFTGFAYDELVRIYKTERNFNRLVDVCAKAAKAQPQDTVLLGELGSAYLKAGRIGDAISVFKKIIDREPDAVAIYCLLGEAFVAEGEYAQAEAVYASAAGIEPDAACTFYSRLAHCYLSAEEHARAETLFRKCLETEGENPLYHCSLGEALLRQGKVAEAKAAYETAIALHPGSAEAFYRRLASGLPSSL
jgi:tetratricopeptide (TPR) repeat protein